MDAAGSTAGNVRSSTGRPPLPPPGGAPIIGNKSAATVIPANFNPNPFEQEYEHDSNRPIPPARSANGESPAGHHDSPPGTVANRRRNHPGGGVSSGVASPA